MGDVDGNGSIEVTDSLLALQIVTRLVKATPENKRAAVIDKGAAVLPYCKDAAGAGRNMGSQIRIQIGRRLFQIDTRIRGADAKPVGKLRRRPDYLALALVLLQKSKPVVVNRSRKNGQ